MSMVFTNSGDYGTATITAATTTQTGSAFVLKEAHDQLLFEISTYTLNSGTGTFTPEIWFSTTFAGTYSQLFAGDAISATLTAPVRYHLTDVTFVLTGFYKIVMTADGTVDATSTVNLYPARRSMS